MLCPNKSSQEYKRLKEALGEVVAMKVFMANGNQVPSMETVNQIIADFPKFDVETAVKDFLASIGVETRIVDSIKDAEGNPISATGKADILNNIIEIVRGKADLSTLTEEAAHFLVEMLGENHPLYQAMYKKIVTMPVYAETLKEYEGAYEGNEEKIRKEAMAKQIVQHVNHGGSGKVFETWFEKFWNTIKKIFGRTSTDEFNEVYGRVKGDPFVAAADKIINNDTEGLTKPTEEGVYYQLDKGGEVAKTLTDSQSRLLYDSVKKVYTVDGKEVKNRVSELAKAAGKKRNRNYQETKKDSVAATVGTMTHEILQDIVDVTAGNKPAGMFNRLGDFEKSVYTSLYPAFSKFTKDVLAKDPTARILTEIRVYDEKRDVAGTVDMLIIWSDGTASIYDYKTSEYENIHPLKEKEYDTQIAEYKKILGKGNPLLGIPAIKGFRESRILPVRTVYNNGKVTEVKPVLKDGNLVEMPVAYEQTGNAKIDELLQKMLEKVESLEAMPKSSDPKKREAQTERIAKMRKAIKDLQLKGDVEVLFEDMIYELGKIGQMVNSIKDGEIISDEIKEELEDALKVTRLYMDMKKYIPKDKFADKDSELRKKADHIIKNALYLSQQLEETIVTAVQQIGEQEGFEDMLPARKETTLIQKWFKSLSQINHPFFRTFYSLLRKALVKIRVESEELNTKIKTNLDALNLWAKAKGLSGTDIFRPLLKMKDGKWTGDLITRFKSEFYSERERAVRENDTDWLNKNIEIDIEKYNAAYERYHNIIMAQDYGTESDRIRTEKLDIWKRKNKWTYYKVINDTWEASEWKYMNLPENKPLLDFYNLFTETVKELGQELPIDLKHGFVPNIKKNLIERIVSNGIAGANLKADALGSLEIKTGDADKQIGMFDPITGARVYSVPVYYTTALEADQKSNDLGKVLQLFGDMAYNYKHMKEIETNVGLLKHQLSVQQQVLVGPDGKPVNHKITDKVRTALGNTNTLEQFTDFVNYYIYGVRNKESWNVQKNGKTYSIDKLIMNVLNYTSAKSLGLNLFSATANAVGGMSNAYITGANGKYYTNGDMTKSLYDVSSKNEKAYDMIGFFDVMLSDEKYNRANKLSMSKAARAITLDKLFILHKKPDFVIQNSILLSMIKSHTIVDGKIMSISEANKLNRPENFYSLTKAERNEIWRGLKKTEHKSLWEMGYEITEEGIKFGDTLFDHNEADKFRRKVQGVIKKVLGNTSQDDISTVKLTTLGKAVMHFRNWIPRTVEARFGATNYNQDLDGFERGRYVSAFNHFLSMSTLKQITKLNFELLTDPTKRAKELYAEFKEKHPESEISETEFIDLHIENLRAMLKEIALIAGVLTLLIGLKPDDDDDEEYAKSGGVKFAIHNLNRIYDELSFYSNPSSFRAIIKSPISLLSVTDGFFSLIKHGFNEGVAQITGDEKNAKAAKPMKYLFQQLPIGNFGYRAYELAAE